MSHHSFRRHVFYFPGFDPRGASFYHRIYREESDKQSAVNGLTASVGRRRRVSDVSQGWTVHAQDGATRVETCYEFMVWDDIVRAHWPKGYAALLLSALRFIFFYVFSGAIFKIAKTSWPPTVTIIYPVVFIILAIILALFAAWSVAVLLLPLAGVWLAGIAATLAFALALMGARRLGDRINVFWLLRIYAFTAEWGRVGIPALDARMQAFAERIQAVMASDDCDEILVLGHSVGTIMVVPVLARLLEKGDTERRLTLVTLGEIIPLLSLLPQAEAYRRDLARVAKASSRILWADFTAAVDSACFPLVNPVLASGLALEQGEGPFILSTRFHTLFHPASYRRIRRDWYRMHFQYLMSTELQGSYDIFAMTGGALSVSRRFAEQMKR
ncbi:MAG: hypothetical protein AB1717_08145 [Pseudomonadota bacterium]